MRDKIREYVFPFFILNVVRYLKSDKINVRHSMLIIIVYNNVNINMTCARFCN